MNFKQFLISYTEKVDTMHPHYPICIIRGYKITAVVTVSPTVVPELTLLPVHPAFKCCDTVSADDYIFFFFSVCKDNFQSVRRVSNHILNRIDINDKVPANPEECFRINQLLYIIKRIINRVALS